MTGYALALDHKPDLILMGGQLPVESGSAVIGRMKQDQRLRDIPVIGHSASEEMLFGLLEAGAVCCVAKPIAVLEFMWKVESVLGAGARHVDHIC